MCSAQKTRLAVRRGDASTRIRAWIDSKGKSYESRRVREKQLMQQMMWRTLIWMSSDKKQGYDEDRTVLCAETRSI
jgi:hypothetical protein